jgi:hypothetical protein
MNYEEFRKNFYVEVPEIARITDAELADIHLALDNMQVRGKGPPKPIKTWIQAGISMKILGKCLVLKYLALQIFLVITPRVHTQWRNVGCLAKKSPLGDKKSPLRGAPRLRVYLGQFVKKWPKKPNK